MQTMVSSQVWQRRTHKIIAMAVIIIGLTMMISTIPQCIYIGLIFIMASLGWLAWIRMKEKKIEPPGPAPAPHGTVSPVLFLVASQSYIQRPCGPPTPANPNDKPPSYDQIIKLDGLPPDYLTILAASPPRYEDIEKIWSVAIPIEEEAPVLPEVHTYRNLCCTGISTSSSSNSISKSISKSNSLSSMCGYSGPQAGEVAPSTEDSGEVGSKTSPADQPFRLDGMP